MWIYDGSEWIEEGTTEVKSEPNRPQYDLYLPELQVIEYVPTLPATRHVPVVPFPLP
ncbi:MAG: hypothetical protein JWN02_476 [Acidobacteria bacterium]|nr:hypothetical protein [Acidobacteriota bacterium]